MHIATNLPSTSCGGSGDMEASVEQGASAQIITKISCY
jgi:hypothetical protein